MQQFNDREYHTFRIQMSITTTISRHEEDVMEVFNGYIKKALDSWTEYITLTNEEEPRVRSSPTLELATCRKEGFR